MASFPSPRFRLLFIFALCACTLSCSSDSDPTSPTDSSQAAATIGPEGGSLSVKSESGKRAELIIPEGALEENVPMRLTAEEAPLDVWAQFRLEPSGQWLRAPAIFRIAFESEEEASPWAISMSTGENRHWVPSEFVDGALQFELWDTGIARSVSNRRQKDVGDGDSTLLQVKAVDCTPELATYEARLAELHALLDSGSATAEELVGIARELARSIVALQQSCPEESNEAFIPVLEAACAQYDETSLLVDLFVFDAGIDARELYWELEELGAKLLSAAVIPAQFGAECAAEYEDIIDGLIDRFLATYKSAIGTPGFLDSIETWRGLWATLWHAATRMLRFSQELGLSDATESFKAQLLPALYNAYWPIAREGCLDPRAPEQIYLVDLLTGGHYSKRAVWLVRTVGEGESERVTYFPNWDNLAMTEEELLRDVQYCGAEFSVTAVDVFGERGQSEPLGEQPFPELPLRRAVLQVEEDGSIQFDGTLRAFRCYPPSESAYTSNDALEFRVDDAVIHTVSKPASADFLSTMVDIPVHELIDFESGATSATLNIYRVGSACQGWYVAKPGLSDHEELLYEIQLSSDRFEPVEVELIPTLHGDPGVGHTPVTVSVPAGRLELTILEAPHRAWSYLFGREDTWNTSYKIRLGVGGSFEGGLWSNSKDGDDAWNALEDKSSIIDVPEPTSMTLFFSDDKLEDNTGGLTIRIARPAPTTSKN